MRKPPSLLKRTLLTVGALIGVLTFLWLLTVIDFAPEQNDCEFGEVTKADFQRLLERAKEQTWTVWPKLSGFSANIQGAILLAAIRELSDDNEPENKQIAAAHAVMRGVAARYLHYSDVTNGRSRNSQIVKRRIVFSYYIPARRFAPWCLFCFVWKYAIIHISFERVKDASPLSLKYITVLHPDLKFNPDPDEWRNTESACPSLPKAGQ